MSADKTTLHDNSPLVRAQKEVMGLTMDNRVLRGEVERLRSVIKVARSVCGQNNCNCPGAPRVKAALENLNV